MTECEPEAYSESVQWARALHEQHPNLVGLYWVARRYNEGCTLVLFGNRVPTNTLRVEHGPIPLRYFQTEVGEIAARCDIDINRR